MIGANPDHPKTPASAQESSEEDTVHVVDGVPVTTSTCPRVGYDADRQTSAREATAIVTMLIFFGYFYTLPLMPLVMVYAALTERWGLFTALLILLSTAFWPTGGHWKEPWCGISPFKRWWIWSTWRGYFNFRKVLLTELDLDQKYMWVEYPHAIFPMGSLLTGSYFDSGMQKFVASGKSIRGLATSTAFRVPLLRHMWSWGGLVPATKENFARTFDTCGSCAVLPGGIAEMFLEGDGRTERIYLKSRFGFVKVAIEAGAHLVPIYYFGQTSLFRHIGCHSGGLLQWLSRRLRVSLVFFHGRFGLPIPYKHPMVAVVGKPLKVERTANPSRELVQRYHAQLMDAVKELFDSHKHCVGWQDKELIIE